ncbi:MAG: two-component system response regulator VanR [Sulfurimonas sp.]|jgi:two-component system response regulator VanR|uniref:response regulator transcription factor n=1 Tax=Sulfurimonas sp. TaxID=2022749 RepID=UPI0039E72636
MNDKHPYTILFVEDEKEIRDNYMKYLQRHFLNVFEAVDGEDGYRVYKEKKPHIMIVDINLPKLNGLDLVRRIREHDQGVKIIMLTAYSDVKYLLEAAELKLIKYLVKPISRGELTQSLDLALGEFTQFEIIQKQVIQLQEGYSWETVSQSMLNDVGEVYLTNKEKKIVALLISNPNNVFTYDDIICETWDDYSQDKVDPLKTMIKNIRKKLPKNVIKNVFGVGYKF